jgi:hypothetical protein
VGVPFGAILRLPLGSPGREKPFELGSVANHRVYYKGEGGGFPQVRAVMSLMCPCCLWFILAPKVLQLYINHLVWIVCRPVWVSEACRLFLVPSQNSNTPLYPSKCCELGSVPRLVPPPLSFTLTHIWVLQGVGGASFAHECVIKTMCINKVGMNPSNFRAIA